MLSWSSKVGGIYYFLLTTVVGGNENELEEKGRKEREGEDWERMMRDPSREG